MGTVVHNNDRIGSNNTLGMVPQFVSWLGAAPFFFEGPIRVVCEW